jgi:hypothetical protein
VAQLNLAQAIQKLSTPALACFLTRLFCSFELTTQCNKMVDLSSYFDHERFEKNTFELISPTDSMVELSFFSDPEILGKR